MLYRELVGMNWFLLLYTSTFNILLCGVGANIRVPRSTPMLFLRPNITGDVVFCNEKHFNYTCVSKYLPGGSHLFWFETTDNSIRILDADSLDGATALKIKYILPNSFTQGSSIHCEAIKNGVTISKTKSITLKKRCDIHGDNGLPELQHEPIVYLRPMMTDDYVEYCEEKHISYTCVSKNMPDGTRLFWYEKKDTSIRTLHADTINLRVTGTTALRVEYNILSSSITQQTSIYCEATKNGITISKTKIITFKANCGRHENRDNSTIQEPENKDRQKENANGAAWTLSIALIAAGSLCSVIVFVVYRKCCRKRKCRTEPIQPETEEPEYSYIPIEMTSTYATRALIAGNKRLGPKSFVPRVPPRPEEIYDYTYAHAY